MKKTIYLCLSAALFMTCLPGISQTLAEADAAYFRQDYKTAFDMYKKLGDEGDAAAQYQLGHLYESGRYVSQSFDNAEPWYRKSAMQGYAKAQANLAWLYVNGKGGLAKDVLQAVLWYEKAAAQGDSEAQERIDNLYNFYPDLRASVARQKETVIEKKQQEIAAQRQTEFNAQSEKTRQESLTCMSKLADDPRTLSLASKFALDSKKAASMEMLANTSKPGAKDKPALSYIVGEWERCIDIQMEPRRKFLPPEVDSLISSYRLELRTGFADLYAGKSSYGDMARLRAKLDIDFKQKLDALTAKFQAQEFAEAKQKQEAEAQKRYAEAQSQQQREAEKQRQADARRALDMQEAQAHAQLEQTKQLQRNVDFLQGLQMQQMFNPRPQQQQQQVVQQVDNSVYVQQAPPPPPPPPTPSRRVNCSSTRLGNTVTTNCF
ncbi:hypothetical protein [Undibacterium sp. Tian12W]|uniref:hypothetical protein n=1 Tax=Undibacterium sp. Tian12W TaxID=3413054 RepID=UPI003BF12616